jgi:redox-sensitive bicupin YhaK (pirin superfamily)
MSNPARSETLAEFRSLRLINRDRVGRGKGFGTHPHQDFEIISYIVASPRTKTASAGQAAIRFSSYAHRVVQLTVAL